MSELGTRPIPKILYESKITLSVILCSLATVDDVAGWDAVTEYIPASLSRDVSKHDHRRIVFLILDLERISIDAESRCLGLRKWAKTSFL